MRAVATMLCYVLVTTQVVAQDPRIVDSLEALLSESSDTARLNIYTELIKEHLFTDHFKAKEFLDEYLTLAEDKGSNEQVAHGVNMQGIYYNITSQNQESLETFRHAKELYADIGNRERVSAMLNNMSIANRDLGNLEAALQNQMESLAIKEEIGVDDEALAASYLNIGNITSDIGNYTESNAWYRKAGEIYSRLGLEDDRIDIIFDIAINLRDMDSLETAKPMFDEALAHYRKRGFNNSIAGTLDIMGGIAKREGNLDKAEEFYLESLEISLQNGEESLPGLLYRRLANVYREKGQYSRALDFAQRALASSRKADMRKRMITDYLVLSRVHEAMGQIPEALDYYKRYHALNDSVFAEEKILAMNEMEVKYQAEKKDQEIALLNEQAKRSALRQKTLIGAMAALVLILVALIYGIRQRIRRNRLAKEKLDAELAFKKRELSAFTLQLAHKNEVLKDIQNDLGGLRPTPQQNRDLRRINRKIDTNLSDNTDWDQFLHRFEAVHQGYTQNVHEAYPEITRNDLRLMALMKMHLSPKEIASMLNLSNEGIKKARYRLRKKLGLETSQSLDDFVIALF